MNHLDLLKTLLFALERETRDYSPLEYLHMLEYFTDEEYEELKRIETVAKEGSHE